MPDSKTILQSGLAHDLIGIVPWRFGDARYVIAYALGVLGNLTSTKIANLLKREKERIARKVLPAGFPFHALIDTSSACNLECPYCPTGTRRVSGRKKKTIDVDLVEKFIEIYGKYLIAADLFNWGEALLHPGIHEIVRLFHENHIFHQISSNLNIRDKSVLEKICDAGLDVLIVSVSGSTQDIYERYHKRGDLSLVLDNLKYIIEYKKKYRRFTPVIHLKFLTFKYNHHQVDELSRIAHDIGVDIFSSHIAGGPEEEIIQLDEGKRSVLYPDTGVLCCQLWRSVVLNSDGGISPCCFLYFKEDDFTDTLPVDETVSRYVEARSMFNGRAAGGLSPQLQHPCLKCSFVHRQKHLAQYLSENPNAKRGHRTGGP